MGGRFGLAGHLAWRVGAAVVVVIAASALIFGAMELLPGDAVDVIAAKHAAGGSMTPELRVELRAELGLDRPLVERYTEWIGGVLHGDLGRSLFSGRPITEIIGARLGNTVVLAATAAVLLLVLAIGFGMWAGTRAGRATDRVITTASVTLGALPEFVIATLLIQLFAFTWPVLPPVSMVAPGHNPLHTPEVLLLPVLALVAVMAPQTIRMVRAQMAEVMASPYIQAARLHGIGEWRIITRHALRNALAPALPLLAGSIAWLIGGVVVVETVFNYPGISRDLVHGIATRDLPYIQSVTLVMAVFTVAVHLLADLGVLAAVPQLRATAGRRR